MNLGDLLADAYRRLGYDDNPPNKVVVRLTAFANEQHRYLLSLPGLRLLRDGIITVASVANTPTVALPQTVARLNGVHDRTNQRVLQELTLDELRRRDPGLTAVGTPWAFVRMGFVQVAVQPVDASRVFVTSDNASDTGKAFIEGIRTGGYPANATVTMTGVTAVDLDTNTTDWIEVTKAYLDTPAVGTVTFHEDSGLGATLATIPIGQQFARYQQIQFYPTPADAVTYYCDVTRTVPDLINATDEPLIPPDFHDLISLGIRRREFEQKADPRLAIVRNEEQERLVALRYFVQASGAQTLSRRGRSRVRAWSQLGPDYPAGS